MSADDIQHGGTHYKQFKNFEPWDVITAWNLGYLDGTALKYIARWRHKNGIEDLQKAVHFLTKCIETELAKSPVSPVAERNQLLPVRPNTGNGDVMVQLFGAGQPDPFPWSSNLNTTPILRPDNV